MLLRPTILRGLSALLRPCYCATCTSWHPSDEPLPETLAAKPNTLRLTLATGQRIELERPRLVGDSVIGVETLTAMQLRDPKVVDKKPRAAVALADIKAVEQAEFSVGKTLVVLVGLGAIVAVIAAASSLSVGGVQGMGGSGGDGGCCSSCPFAYSWDRTTW